MTKQSKTLLLILTILILLGGVVLPWPRIGQLLTRFYTLLSMPVYDAPIIKDEAQTNLIFLHHSTGRGLIAQGNVRSLLSAEGYQFWDHDYNNIGLTTPDGTLAHANYKIPGRLGMGNTDVDGLVALLQQPTTDPPQNAFSRLLQHDVIILKSCFPNSAITDDDMLQQFQDSYEEMREVVREHPEHLFIILTSPPLHPLATTPDEAARARQMADWLVSDRTFAKPPNLFVFDFFDLLADSDQNTLQVTYQKAPTEPDSHPNREANETIGPQFVTFVDMAIETYREP